MTPDRAARVEGAVARAGDTISPADLVELVKETGPSASIYLPVHRFGAVTRADRSRFAHILGEARDLLARGQGLRGAADEVLGPASRLCEDEWLWRHQNLGLGVLVSSKTFRTFRLPAPVDELLFVGRRFDTRPLLPFQSDDDSFLLLALSQHRVRLFRGTAQGLGEMQVSELPADIRDALRYDAPEERVRFHDTVPSGGGPGVGLYHGRGGSVDSHKNRLLRFFRAVDEALRKEVGDSRTPLILAAVRYLVPIYRRASTYPNLRDASIPGNPDHLPLDVLHARALAILRGEWRRSQERATASYRSLAGTGRSSSDLEEILIAAAKRRVDTLLVDVRVPRWGAFDVETGRLAVHGTRQATDDDLVDLAAARTLRAGGRVFAMDRSAVPGGEPIAALLRF